MSGFRVYVSPPDVNERNIKTLMYTLSIGWVTAEVSGRVSSIPVYLKTPAVKGVTYTLTDKLGEQIEVVVTDNVRTGYVNLPIQPQTVDVLKDEYILTSSSYLNTILQNDPGRIQESLEQDRNVNDLGRLNETINQGQNKSTLALSNVSDSFRLLAGQQLILIRNAGITGTNRLRAAQETVQVDVDQDVVPTDGLATISIVEKSFLHSHNPSLSFLIRPIFAMVGDINAAQEAQDATDALLESAKQFGSSLIFEASDRETVTWAAGTIEIQDGTTYNINSGSFSLTDNTYRYIYYTRTGSTLSITTTLATAVQTGNILLATTRRGTDANQRAWVVPAVGKLYLSQENLAPNSVTADKIFVNQLSAVTADMGTLTAGQITIVSSGNTVWLNPNTSLGLAIGGTTVASAPFRVAYSGAFTATNATITGSITATSGAITGNLSVTGTLTMGTNGKITNGGGDYQITNDGFELFQKVTSAGTVETDESRMLVWADRTGVGEPNLIYRTALVSYAESSGSVGRAVDITGFDETKYIRWTLRRKLSGTGAAQDFTIGVVAVAGQFASGTAVGDSVIEAAGSSTIWFDSPLRTTGALTLGGALTGTTGNFSGVVTVANATADGHALNRITADGRFPRTSTDNVWGGINTFNGGVTVQQGNFVILGSFGTYSVRFSFFDSTENRIITVPDQSGTMALLERTQTWSANQTFQNNRLRLEAVSSGGIATLSYAATANSYTYTIPVTGANRTFAFINHPQTFTAAQAFSSLATFQNGIELVGDGANVTIVNIGNATRTVQIPTLGGTRTMAFINQDQTISGVNEYSGNQVFQYNTLRLKAVSGSNNANLRYGGTVSATFNLPTAGGDLVIVESTAGLPTPNTGLVIQYGSNRYRIPAIIEP